MLHWATSVRLFSSEISHFIILYFISSFKMLFISWNFYPVLENKPWCEPLAVFFWFPQIPYAPMLKNCHKLRKQINRVCAEWLVDQIRSYSRYSEDLNGFRTNSIDLEFGIVEDYKMCFQFESTFSLNLPPY